MRVSLLLAALVCASPAAAQGGPPAGEEPASAPGPGAVDAEEAELDRMQREAEAAEPAPPAGAVVEAPREEEPPAGSLHHGDQVGIRAGIAVPYVFAVKYGDGPLCDDEGETFCRRFGAAMLELELGFGVSERVELSVLARFGLADDAAAQRAPLAFGLGARAYGAPDPMLKMFFGGRVVVDVTASDVPRWKGVDVGLRGELGLQVDLVRHVGIYLQLGETVTVLRGLYFVTDLSLGAQARFP